MEVIYLRQFKKDIQPLPDTTLKQLKKIIFSCKEASSIHHVSSVKKMKGHPDAYRIRCGNYRIGIFVTDNKIEFVRICHRKDIYKYFP